MNVIIWLVVGGAMGWMAHRIMKTDGRQGVGPNVLVGIVGGLAGGWLLSPVVGADTADQHVLAGATVESQTNHAGGQASRLHIVVAA